MSEPKETTPFRGPARAGKASEGQPPPSPPAAPAESPEAELIRLRAENAHLRQGLAPDGSPLSRAVGPRQKYRVKLPSLIHQDGRITYVKLRQSSRVVSPRPPMAGSPPIPEPFRKLPTESYDTQELSTEGEPSLIAWQRYAAAHKLDAQGDRDYFKIRVAMGAMTDYLDVEAVSEADAFEAFKKFCGIHITMSRPEVVALAS
jgi:hypothetical protein